jgi:transposase InsO family protein
LILSPKKGIPVLAAARIQRWAIELSAYDYELRHKPAERNCHADALSRLPLDNVEQPTGLINWTKEATIINLEQVSHLPITAKAISKEIRKDAVLAKVLFLTQNGWPERLDLSRELQPYFNRRMELSVEEGCLLLGTRTIIPQKFQNLILQELHSNHPGIVRMKALARMHVWWPAIDKDIEKVVRICKICQELQPKSPKAEANPWKWPTQPWQRIHVDFAFYKHENFLIIVDAHSKWTEVHHMKSTTTEKTMETMRRVFAQHGVPLELVSDNGPQFTSENFEKFLKLNNIKHLKSPAFHPSTNGEAERFVQTFKKGMKARKHLKNSWNMKIMDFLLSYRTTPHSMTRRTPAELLVGRNLRTRLDALHPNIGVRIEQQSSPKKDCRVIGVGEPVLVRDYRQKKESWICGVVTRKLSPCTYIVEVDDLVWKRHIDQLRSLDGQLLENKQMENAAYSEEPKKDEIWTEAIPYHPEVDVSQAEMNAPDETVNISPAEKNAPDKTSVHIPVNTSPQGEVDPSVETEVDDIPASQEVENNEVIVPRRSTRKKQPPKYLNDYKL